MKKTVVLYPGLAVSHLVPVVQLADALLEEGYAVVVALIDISNEQNIDFAAAVDRAAASKPSVTFHTLPRIKDPPSIAYDARFILRYFALVRRYNKHLGELLCSLPPGSVHAVIVDALSNEAIDVTREMGIPAYRLHLLRLECFRPRRITPALLDPYGGSAKLQGARRLPSRLVRCPRPVPASRLFHEFLEDPKSEIYQAMVSSFRKNLEANGMLVNAFALLDARDIVKGNVERPETAFRGWERETLFSFPQCKSSS
ncbi:hypothetical protein GQ55_3G195200 [Panicum hallii var. hallii]|uniref:Uncharacterized protein n=1 Tax=Panicum hallii var. hallii TaxID=1504633 RepID=A0A2T7EBA2_9POAL|nr:hypothetical protein GQ55_3G195200 [Panicum hallii var. hallii]